MTASSVNCPRDEYSLTKTLVAQKLLSALKVSPELLQPLFEEFSQGCADLSAFSTSDAVDFSRELSSDLFAVLTALSRLATYAERLQAQTSAQQEQRSVFIERLKNAYSDERPTVMKEDVVLTLDPESGLLSAVSKAMLSSPFFTLKPMSALDVMQGYGYDFINEEDGPLAPFLWFGNEQRSPAHESVKALIRTWMRARSSPSVLRVLDIGTGSCTSLLKLAAQVPKETHLYACDICGPILSQGIARLMARDIVPNLLLCDAQNLPYQDESFDIVINFGSIDQVPAPGKALAEMFRVLKSGGLAICRDEHYTPSDLTIHKRIWYGFLGASFGTTPPPLELVPSGAKDVAVQMLNELNFVLSFTK